MIRKLWNVVSTLAVLLIIILAVLLAGVRAIGLTPYCVLSGSMEPEFHTGSLIYVKKAQAKDVKIGDPITFVLNNDLAVVTHRVIEIDYENQCFYTKGDANDDPDGSPVYFDNLIGKPVLTIPYMGYVSRYIASPPVMYVVICVAFILIIVAIFPDLINKTGENKNKLQGKGSG